MRSVVLVGDMKANTNHKDVLGKHLKKLRGKLLSNTIVVHLPAPGSPELETPEAKWFLERNTLMKEVVKQAERQARKTGGGPLVQICEGMRCLDVFDMSEIEQAIEELG